MASIQTENCADKWKRNQLETCPVSNLLCGLEVPTPLQV